MSAFDTLIPDVQDFCRRLAADNTAEFYKAHKAEYLSRLKRPAELLLDSLAPRIAEMTGGTVTTKLFRINRDLRFAKGQPPYKDYLHMLWYSPADGPAPMGWFFGVETDRVRVGAGYMGFDGPALTRWREVMKEPGSPPASRRNLPPVQRCGMRRSNGFRRPIRRIIRRRRS